MYARMYAFADEFGEACSRAPRENITPHMLIHMHACTDICTYMYTRTQVHAYSRVCGEAGWLRARLTAPNPTKRE